MAIVLYPQTQPKTHMKNTWEHPPKKLHCFLYYTRIDFFFCHYFLNNKQLYTVLILLSYIMHNQVISHIQENVSRLYVNATPFHIKDFSPSTLASLWALDLVPVGLL